MGLYVTLIWVPCSSHLHPTHHEEHQCHWHLLFPLTIYRQCRREEEKGGEGKRERGKEGEREGGREGRREGGREGGREGEKTLNYVFYKVP